MNKIIILALITVTSTIVFGQVDLINENFQSGIPVNWTIANNDSNSPVDPIYTNAWVVVADPENNLDSVASSTSYFNPADTASRWLITPPLLLGAYGNHISWKAKSHDPSYPDDYIVLVSTTNTELASFTDTIGLVQEENFEWTYRQVDLALEGYISQTIYVAFVNNTVDGYILYMDSIHAVKEDPVSINEIQKLEFSVYPNPASDKIQIVSPFDITSIRIINTSGQVVMKENNPEFLISSLDSGVYYIEALINGYTVTRKFIKE